MFFIALLIFSYILHFNFFAVFEHYTLVVGSLVLKTEQFDLKSSIYWYFFRSFKSS